MSRLCKLNYVSYVNHIIPLNIYMKNIVSYNSLFYKKLNKLYILTCILFTNCGIIKLTYKLGGNMKQKPKKTVKNQALKKQNLLYHKAEEITDHLFQTNDFFDPHDLLQVKYEMSSTSLKSNCSFSKVTPQSAERRMAGY